MTAAEPLRTFSAVPPVPDPDLDGAPGDGTEVASSPLASLAAELGAELGGDTTEVDVPMRPGWQVRLSTSIAYEELASWRKRAGDRSMPGGVNELRLACIMLGNQGRAILRDGQPVTAEGEPLTFRSPELQRMLGVDRAVDAVRKFYGRDGHVTKAARELLAAAGYGDDPGEVPPDPTGL